MAGRRSLLHGVSEREREDRAYQQRDYAAQLQEQVRLKNERLEADKARRLHEQKIEREEMDKERAEANKVNQRHVPLSSPIRSPKRIQQPLELEIQHTTTTVVGGGSPSKLSSTLNIPGGRSFGDYAPSQVPATNFASVVAPFASGPSIFDALLQVDSGKQTGFHEDLEALRTMRLEVETKWKQRRSAIQNTYEKPSFLITIQPSVTSNIALTREEKRQLDEEIELETPVSSYDEANSSALGLVGESVLIPVKPINSPRSIDHQSETVLRQESGFMQYQMT